MPKQNMELTEKLFNELTEKVNKAGGTPTHVLVNGVMVYVGDARIGGEKIKKFRDRMGWSTKKRK